MKKTTVEKLNKVLDVTGDLIPVGNNKKAPDAEIIETDLTSDYDFSRDQYHNLVTKVMMLLMNC